MKIIRSILTFITYLLAGVAILVSIGSAVCKFIDLPEDSFIQIFGYISFYWVLLFSAIVLVSFLLLRNFRTAFYYLALLMIFTLLLNDFSIKYMHPRKQVLNDRYDSLSVFAYNVKHYDYGIDQIAGFISKSDYDVVLLSESALTTEKLDYLNKRLGEYTVLSDSGRDLSILSRYPVMNFKMVDLPTHLASFTSGNDVDSLLANGIHRSFVHATINVNGTFVNVLSLRLIAGRPKNKSFHEEIRWGKYLLKAQNEELSTFLNYMHTLHGPVIFGGDLNVSPNTGIIHKINHYANDTFLDDHAFGSFTFKVSFPTMRLDYLFRSKDIITKMSKIIKPDTLLSDHFPISAKFLIPEETNSTDM